MKELNLVELKKMRGKIARIHLQLRMKKGVKRVSLKTKKLMKKRTRSKTMILLALNQKKKHKQKRIGKQLILLLQMIHLFLSRIVILHSLPCLYLGHY